MKVRDPEGQTWRVTRRWVPWRRHARSIDTSWSFGDIDVDDSLLIGIALFFLAPIILLTLLVAGEFLLLLLLLPAAVLARTLFGKEWTVEARRGYRVWWDAPAGDWKASGQRIRDVAEAIRRGEREVLTNDSPGVHPDTPS